MQAGLKPGTAFEVEGRWDPAGVFIVTDMEILPKERSPKLRGAIQAIDREAGRITLYGRSLEVSDETEFVQDGGTKITFDKLAKGQRIEVSCKVSAKGEWKARKITTGGVKDSDKIKATVTRAAIDGEAPDTIEVHGLKLLLDRATDINDPESSLHDAEKELFGDLGFGSTPDFGHGRWLGPKVHADAEYRQNVSSQSEYDLSPPPTDSDEQDTEADGRVELQAIPGPRVRALAELRVRKRFYLQSDQNLPSPDGEIHFTQVYVLARLARGLAVQVGRQDFDEPREWIFDEYLDAARVYYYGASPLVLEAALIDAVSPIKPKFETWTDYFVRARFYTDRKSRLAAWMLARRDSDVRNREPVWWGLRYHGEPARGLRSWADFALMRGEDKQKSLSAWAMDVGATVIATSARFRPYATVGYAVGSGDDTGGDDVNHSFRQTSYEDNVDRFGGVTSFSYYGSILDPELSNLKIVTLGVGMRPVPKASVDIVYHGYRQHRLDNQVQGSDLIDPPARPNGVSDDLGWGLDLIVGVPRLWNVVQVKGVLAFFNPGLAFAPRNENAFLGQLNIHLQV
jgi:alginate production protein